ncbi:MAG TPA: tRNA (adenosine(37)-N6)-threonylcarbamoyltransferase complex ATPase subunit type 1 TsaE [Devosia sp.]|nr:tRNA (adenosine(37)-N6)-threonylcarbamoyltransferase complex ATPase subunit type 1 TsaE [Devosia sp.]
MGTERILLADDGATAALGVRLAAALKPGDLVLLAGGLGAGKTALARAIIRALAADPGLEVPSPSFALVQPYDLTGGPILHADLYRLASAREIAELGLFDRPEAIVLVEWPERAPDLEARATLKVTLSVPSDGDGRIAEIAT